MSEADKTEELEIDGMGEIDEDPNEATIDKNAKKKIFWLPQDFSIRELLLMRADKDLDPRPQFQRNFVFDRQKASKLIESILLDVPIPDIYFAEGRDGKYSVIDGQQRLTSFLSFVDEKFPVGDSFIDFTLSGLKILTELNKKKFSDLEPDIQAKIKSTALHTIIIKKDSDDDVKFDIFERLNTGSMKLNEDEIRNSVYRGPYIELLDELADDKTFGDLVRKPNYKIRMWYRGMILRFLALSEKTYINYRPSMKQFCNKELRERQYMSQEKIKEYRIRFRKSVDLCQTVFGENAFRRFKPGDLANRDGNWVASRINMALFDVQMCGFVPYTNNQIVNHADTIREALLDIMCNDQDFIQSIEIQTSSTKQMALRFEKWLGVLKQILADSPPDQRIFPYAIKQQLYKDDPTCKICGNQILTIADAEVDHKDPYSKGGPTTIGNAQIAHRYCNRHKGDKNK